MSWESDEDLSFGDEGLVEEDEEDMLDDEDEDETLKELERERKEKERIANAKTVKKTFAELMAERAERDAIEEAARRRAAEATEMSEADLADRIRKGQKAAEDADNALAENLFGSSSSASSAAASAQRTATMVNAVDDLTISSEADYGQLAQIILERVTAAGGSHSAIAFLQPFLQELGTKKMASSLKKIVDTLADAQKAELEAEEVARKEEEKKKAATASTDAMYDAFGGLGGGSDDGEEDDSDDSSDDGFM